MTPAERLYMEDARAKFSGGDNTIYELEIGQIRFLYCLMRRLYEERAWAPDECRDIAQRLDAFVVSKI